MEDNSARLLIIATILHDEDEDNPRLVKFVVVVVVQMSDLSCPSDKTIFSPGLKAGMPR